MSINPVYSEASDAPVEAVVASLLNRAAALEPARPTSARALLDTARALAPDDGAVALAHARLLLRERQVDRALATLDGALARDPRANALLVLRAEGRLMAGDPTGAAADAAEAVVAAPGDPGAKALLGTAMGALGHYADARACLHEAVRGEPGNPHFLQALARSQTLCGDAAAARVTLAEGIQRLPEEVSLRVSAAKLAIEQGDLAEAEAIARSAREDGVVDACLAGLHGHALSSLGRDLEASVAYADALSLAPEDGYVRHLVAASGRIAPTDRAPDDYVRTLFNGYADRFEAHLLALGYRVPGLLRRAVQAHVALPATDAGTRVGPVLDLGCGTGLAALAMSDLPLGPWHGVDLSPAMLRKAREKQLYATLREGEIGAVLTENGPTCELIVAADVLCYVGDLAGVFDGIARRLAANGIAVASLECLADADGWMLGDRGRYRHSPRYISEVAQACGLVIRSLEAVALRREAGCSAAGLLAVFGTPA